MDSNDPTAALELFEQACARAPIMPEPQLGRAIAFARMRRNHDALSQAKLALALRPDWADGCYELGAIAMQAGDIDAAYRAYRNCLMLSPTHPDALVNIAGILTMVLRHERAFVALTLSGEARPRRETLHNLMMVQLYRPDVSCADIQSTTRWVAEKLVAGFPSGGPTPIKRRGNHLRVGLVSPDFGPHPVGRFVCAWLAGTKSARSQMNIVGYQCGPYPSGPARALIEAQMSNLRDIFALDDSSAADLIRNDGIDVLIDLVGHTAFNRLPLFLLNPAPVQTSWLGYAGSLALPAIPSMIADEVLIPPQLASNYTERILKLPSFLCHRPPTDAPPVGPSPCLRNGYITFGSFNNPTKINLAVISIWAKILRRLPRAQLLLKYRGYESRLLQQAFGQAFSAEGIAPGRIIFEGAAPVPRQFPDMMDDYARVDIALDSFPYGGSTTTTDALHMGVPVVTWAGDTYASRMTAAILSAAGPLARDGIAEGPTEYVDLATKWAQDPVELNDRRQALRPSLLAAPICDRVSWTAAMSDLLIRLAAG